MHTALCSMLLGEAQTLRCEGSPGCSLGFKTIMHRLTPSGCEEICVLDPALETEFDCGYCNDDIDTGSNRTVGTDGMDGIDTDDDDILNNSRRPTVSSSTTPAPTLNDIAIPLPTLSKPFTIATATSSPTVAVVRTTTSPTVTVPQPLVPSTATPFLFPTYLPTVSRNEPSSPSTSSSSWKPVTTIIPSISPTSSSPSSTSESVSPLTNSPPIAAPASASAPESTPFTRQPVERATGEPTDALSLLPVAAAVAPTTNAPVVNPSSSKPTNTPSNAPVTAARLPTTTPDAKMSTSPIVATTTATPPPTVSTSSGAVTYVPGELTVQENGLLLSTGLRSKLIGTKNQPVQYDTGRQSMVMFHRDADAGAVFVDPNNGGNPGGWIYVSNAEVQPFDGTPIGQGGVGAMTFDRNGQLLDYKMVLQQTTSNCAGGRTPWNSWVSCEEYDEGRCWQVDPTGQRGPQTITMTDSGRGKFEAFAFDVRNANSPHFFVTKDDSWGELRRFTPDTTELNWDTLHGTGTLDYLVLTPNPNANGDSGTYAWVSDRYVSAENAKTNYPNAEGIDVLNNQLFFVAKEIKSMFILDLDSDTYVKTTTTHGLFDGQPDQVQRIIGSNSGLLYFTEDGGEYAGIHARNTQGQFFSILESHEFDEDETTGLAFSPDGKFMYIAYQDNGLLFSVWREDGQSFDAQSLNVKFHAV